jgi:hypothetical protein
MGDNLDRVGNRQLFQLQKNDWKKTRAFLTL